MVSRTKLLTRPIQSHKSVTSSIGARAQFDSTYVQPGTCLAHGLPFSPIYMMIFVLHRRDEDAHQHHCGHSTSSNTTCIAFIRQSSYIITGSTSSCLPHCCVLTHCPTQSYERQPLTKEGAVYMHGQSSLVFSVLNNSNSSGNDNNNNSSSVV